jgi:hypothetical protein
MLAWLYALACSLVECHQMRVCIVSSCFNRFLTGTMNCIASKESGKRLIASQPERKRTLHKNNQRNKKKSDSNPPIEAGACSMHLRKKNACNSCNHKANKTQICTRPLFFYSCQESFLGIFFIFSIYGN